MHAIGDVVQSSIIPQSIKAKHPEYEVHYLTNSLMASILQNCSYIDKVIVYNAKNLKELFKLCAELFKQRYDIVISLNYTLKNYILSFFSCAKKIIFRKYKGKLWVENYFYTAKSAVCDVQKQERLYLENNLEIESKISKELNKYKKPFIVINPGTSANQKREGRVWNIEKWKDLSNKLLKLYGGTIFVNGSNSEREYHLQLEKENVVILSGLYSLEESCAFLSFADLVISGDSGPLHIASAYNVKTLAILGSTSPDKIKPYGKNGYFVEPKTKCKYCWKKKCKLLKENECYAPCIESISVDSVLEKIKEINTADSKPVFKEKTNVGKQTA